jgi:hypothetical protein
MFTFSRPPHLTPSQHPECTADLLRLRGSHVIVQTKEGAYLWECTVITQEYRMNRSRFPQAELATYQGQWVAFSSDGCRIVGRGNTIGELEGQLANAGEDAQRVVFEWVAGPEDDTLAPGGELV